jgi:hypothetical protein
MNRRRFLKTNLFGAIGLALIVTAAFAADQVELSFITDKGWVKFTVGGDWKVLSMKTKDIVRGAIFQIPNPPGDEASAPTNALVTLFELDSAQTAARYANFRQQYAKGTKSRIGVWEVFKREFEEKNTKYTARVAYRDIADVHVCVTFSWPHLPKNSADHEAQMEQMFLSTLKSVNGGLGKYQKREGEVIRRPQ